MFKLLFLLVILLSLSLSKTDDENNEYEETIDEIPIIRAEESFRKIAKGEVAGLMSFPYQVSLRKKDTMNHFCSGAIISQTKVLTAAHCFCGSNKKRAERVRITAGVVSLKSKKGQNYNVKRLVCHPEYNEDLIAHDIALIIIEEKFIGSRTIVSYALPYPDGDTPVRQGIPVAIAGWGAEVFQGNTKDLLHYINAVTISQEECRNYLHPRNPKWAQKLMYSNTCTQNILGPVTCSGDSGGPVIWNHNGVDLLIGVVSWGLECKKGDPTVITAVKHYTSWISSVKN